jgi:NAD(P)-dependent dehydrogenase (short-subunit alcohol dehydrogenase family)
MPKPNSALSSNSELDQAGPRPLASVGVGRGRQVAAVDRRAAGRVRDQEAIAEELGEQLDVRRLAAARARAAELEERLEQLRALGVHAADLLGRSTCGQIEEEVELTFSRSTTARCAGSC